MSRFLAIEIGNEPIEAIGAYWQNTLLSLEQALEPIMSRIDQLDRSIKEAKRRCRYPSEHKLTRDESAAVYLYTMEGGDNSFYRLLNDALRSPKRSGVKPWYGFLKLFDTALSKLPTVTRSVWRGINKDITQDFKKNDILTWWSVSSCSPSLEVVKRFLSAGANSTLLMIEAKNAKDINGYSSFSDENELILAPGTKLRVESNPLDSYGGLHLVHLLEVTDDEVRLLNTRDTMILPSNSRNKGASGFLQPTVASASPSISPSTNNTSTRSHKPNIILEN